MDNKEATIKQTDTPVMRKFTETKSMSSPMKSLMLFIVIGVLGVGTGFMLTKYSGKTGKSLPILSKVGSAQQGKSFGSDDTKTFKDTAEGELQIGGIEDEGQYHLIRPGGDSQNVYLTSGNVDLSKFTGKKIKVWGQTQTAQKAGWLMDVGRVEVL